jgi:hypothetical protein
MPDSNATGSHGPQLALYWLVVAIPLTWGVIETLRNALKLFS